MLKKGMDRRLYPSRKFGSWERPQALDAQVAAAGHEDGLVFRHDIMERTPNIIDAHRLIALAGREGDQNAVVEALFRAYFNEGRDIGDREVLIDVGATTGPDRTHLAAMYASNEGQSEVEQGLQRAAALRISLVPRVLVAGVPLFSGAIRRELMETRLRMAADHGRR